MTSLRTKIFLLFCVLLLLTLALVLGTIYASMQEQVQRGITSQLEVGRQVFLSRFETRRQSLSVHSHLIGKDFGLLSSLQDDTRSLLVALNNHRLRAGADLAIVTDESGRILADTVRPDVTGELFRPWRESVEDLESSLFLTRGGETFQVVSAPLMAPNPVGSLYLGYRVDDSLARQFAGITALGVAFARTTGESISLIASTLPANRANDLRTRLSGTEDVPRRADLGGETFVIESVPLSSAVPGRVRAILLISIDSAMAAYRPWWRQVAEISVAVFLLGLLGAWGVARSIASPLQLLVHQARAVAGGEYQQPITVKSGGEIRQLVDEFNRMQDAISQREESIRYSAYHDGLTGMVNRYRLEQLIDERISAEPGMQRTLATLILDLDRFKDINETLGYRAGDELLREVSERVERVLGPDDVVGRLGGDEFGILLSEFKPGRLNKYLEEITDSVARPFEIDGLAIHVTATVGCAIFPDHGREAAELLRHADTACTRAKEQHKRYSVYEASDNRYSLLRVSLLGELTSAIERGNLELHYQPKLDLRNGRITAGEALVRWRHPVYGLIPPADFIPMLERTGNIHMITLWTLDEALRQISEWRREGLMLGVAINVSAYDLGESELAREVGDALERHGLEADALLLEVTESAVVDDSPMVYNALTEISELGVELAIDDYGTGYSSLGQLKRLPVNELKIDKSFVIDLATSPDDEIIVRSTIDLGHTMGLRVAAEGVETAGVQDTVAKLGCDVAQGHYISRAIPAGEFRAWIKARGWVESALRGS